jgi:hypothetical protein
MAVNFAAPWAGLSLHNEGFNTSPYTHLRFYINAGGGPHLPVISVSLYDTSSRLIKQVNPQKYTAGGGNGWFLVSIPLEDLGGADTTITRVQLQEFAGRDQPTFYLDNLGFQKRDTASVMQISAQLMAASRQFFRVCGTTSIFG